MTKPNVLVVGAGPSGLAVCACLTAKGIAFALVDRYGETGGAYTRMYSRMTVASPARYNSLPGLAVAARGEYMSSAEYAQYLRAYAEHFGLQARATVVHRIERVDEGFRAYFSNGDEATAYRCVIVATGMYDFPIWPAVPGLDANSSVMHSAQWQGPEPYIGKRVLVIGGATSAVEIAEGCARAGAEVVVSVRGRDVRLWPQRFLGRDIHDYVTLLEWLPRGFLKSYCAGTETLPATDCGFRQLERAGKITVRGPIERIEGTSALFRDERRETFDAMICATGYRYDLPGLPETVRGADACESHAWPGLFLVGMPCVRGLNSAFLRGIAADARPVSDRIAQAYA